jgi:hypothetical protein
MTDDYPNETTWDLVHVATGEVMGTGGPLSDPQTLYTWDICVDDDPGGCYRFTIYDVNCDGISLPPGYYNVYDPTGALVCSGGDDFGSSETCFFGTCIGACCDISSYCEDLTPEECADEGGTIYMGESCDDPGFDCPPSREYAIYDNGYPINGDPYDSQCDPAHPFQVACADDFVIPGLRPIEVIGIVVWLDNYGSQPQATPDDYDGLAVTIYNDAGGMPAGNPIDGSPDCAVEGDVVYHWLYLPGGFGYNQEWEGFWRLYFVTDGYHVLNPGETYWLVIEPVMESALHGHSGVLPTGEQTGSLPMVYAPMLGYDDWETPDWWNSDFSFFIIGDCPYGYLAGDCNYNWIVLELADVITMIGTYRGTIENPLTLPCPPYGDNFPATADPNGNCVANELNDVVTEIAAYRGIGDVSSCPACPGGRRLLPGGDGQQLRGR